MSKPPYEDSEFEPGQAFRVGQVLEGRYELDEELGRGSFGLVFRAHDRMADDTVAIKVLHYDREQTPESVEQLRRELRAARKVTHPGIVRTHDAIEIHGRLALSMEFVSGETLKVRLAQKGRLEEAELRKLGVDLASALHAAHGVGVVHCDLKPANIMLRSQDGRVMITDFGISRLQSPAGEGLDERGALSARADTAGAPSATALSVDRPVASEDILHATGLAPEMFASPSPSSAPSEVQKRGFRAFGTPLYMAPELFLPGVRIGPAVDLYALGVVLYEAATGLRPHDRGDLRELVQRRLTEPPIPIGIVRPDLSPELRRVIDGCLAREPVERLTSEEVLRILAPSRPITSWPWPWSWLLARLLGPYRLLLLLLLSLGSMGAWWSISLPLGERRVFIEATWEPGSGDAGSPAHADNAWIGKAAERLLSKRLREDEHRFAVVTEADQANVLVHLRIMPKLEYGSKTHAQAVRIMATIGRPHGWQQSQPPVEAASVKEALDRLLGPLREQIGQGHRKLPSSDEAKAAGTARLGAASPELYRLYTEAVDDLFRSVVVDSEEIESRLRKLIDKDPGWAHPYVALMVVNGRVAPRARKVLTQACAATDPGRDPLGHTLLSFLEFAPQQPERAHQMLEQAAKGVSDDILALNLLATSHATLGHVDQAAGIYRSLYELRPDLQFGTDLISNLERAGRNAEVPIFTRRWPELAPEGIQAHLSTIALDIKEGHHDLAVERARALLRVHGEAPLRLITLCDALLVAGRLGEASDVANRLAGSPNLRMRTFGQYRLGVIDVLQGKFGSARDSLVGAALAQRPWGTESELLQTLETLLSLDERDGRKNDAAAHLEELEQTFVLFGMRAQAAVARYEHALLRRTHGSCPDPKAFLQELDDAQERGLAEREMARATVPIVSSPQDTGSDTDSCARCAAVLQAGFGSDERSTRSIFRFALCAEAEGQLEVAAKAFHRAAQITASSFSTTNGFAPDLAVLAHFRLGSVLERLHRTAEAHQAYERFDYFWGHAEGPIPEVEQAHRALKRTR